eukprot:jgi/Astpho2/2300/Aster-03266
MTITFKIAKAGQPVATRTLKPPLTADEATVVLQRLDDSWIGGLCAEGKQDDFLPPREKLADGATYELHLQEQSGLVTAEPTGYELRDGTYSAGRCQGKRRREATSKSDGEAGPIKKPCADWSGCWINRLKSMLPQQPQLPCTKEEVEATLFPAQSTLRIPVLPAFYGWQDSHDAAEHLEPADADSKDKRLELNGLRFGTVRFMLAYAAAGTWFQLFWISADGKTVEELGEVLNLANVLDRMMLVQALVPGGPPQQKVICNFKHFAEEHATDIDTIKAAYAAASTAALQCQPNQPFIIAAAEPPQLKRGRYQVEVRPVGYPASAAEVLHVAGFLHRDFRMANIVQVGPGAYMVINLEAVGQKTTGPLPEGFTPTGWSSNTLNELRQYTSASDMHQIGLMIDEQLQGVVEPSEEALNFLDQLKHKKLSAVTSVFVRACTTNVVGTVFEAKPKGSRNGSVDDL